MKTILTLISAFFFTQAGFSQATLPFAGCPNENLMIARSGTNSYNNEAVSIYNVDETTGAASIIPGSIKDPANGNHIDINAVGLNFMDGYLYAMSPNATAPPKFYRIASDYGIEQIGVIQPPTTLSAPPPGGFAAGVVNSAAGEVDNAGNYYFTAVTGTGSFAPATFTPDNFYLGSVANVKNLTPGINNLNPMYKVIDFSDPACSEYIASIKATSTPASASNTGLTDLAFNGHDGLLYTYVTFETSANSGIFKSQLLSIKPSTGVVTAYPVTILPEVNATNMVAGVLIDASGKIQILLTQGDIYTADINAAGAYTGEVTKLGSSNFTGGLRGDLASCGQAKLLPVVFESFTSAENNCNLTFQWIVAQENNVKNYNLQLMDNAGTFNDVTTIRANNNPVRHSYSTLVPVTNKTMTARIKQTDNNGKFTFSKILVTNNSCLQTKSIIILNSAAVMEKLQVKFSGFTASTTSIFAIYSAAGVKVLQQNFLIAPYTNISSISLPSLAPGNYFFTTILNNGEKYTAAFLKK